MQRFIRFIFNLYRIFPTPWPAIWVWIMLANVILGLFLPESFTLAIIRLSGIFLCLVYARQIFEKDLLLQVAILITFIADIILALNNTAEIGIIIFFIAQIIHAIRLNGKQLEKLIIIFSIIAFLTISISLFLPFSNIYAICFFYVTALIANIIISWRWYVAQPRNLRAIFSLAGFLLFLCCDICIGLSYLAFNSALPLALYAPANFLAWFFYYPSQILISNSSKTDQLVVSLS